MNILEKRDFIHSHLHIADDGLIDELYLKIQSSIKRKKMIVGFDAKGGEISANQFLKDLKEAEFQIEKGNFLTIYIHTLYSLFLKDNGIFPKRTVLELKNT